jgi:glycine hydroxymethyltransferase
MFKICRQPYSAIAIYQTRFFGSLKEGYHRIMKSNLEEVDPEMYAIIKNEENRQMES